MHSVIYISGRTKWYYQLVRPLNEVKEYDGIDYNEEKLFNELFYSSDEINVADIYITCCAVLLVLFVVFYYKDEELESIFQRKDSKL